MLEAAKTMQVKLGNDMAEERLRADEMTRIKIALDNVSTGVMIANAPGTTPAYSLGPLQERGKLFAAEGDNVYEGQLIGIHSKDNDLTVNAIKPKPLTNMRASGKDEAVKLTTPKKLSLEAALSYIADDELVEVTPKSIRLRKAILDPHERKKAGRKKEAA